MSEVKSVPQVNRSCLQHKEKNYPRTYSPRYGYHTPRAVQNLAGISGAGANRGVDATKMCRRVIGAAPGARWCDVSTAPRPGYPARAGSARRYPNDRELICTRIECVPATPKSGVSQAIRFS